MKVYVLYLLARFSAGIEWCFMREAEGKELIYITEESDCLPFVMNFSSSALKDHSMMHIEFTACN